MSRPVNVAINGFGRIGRNLLRVLLKNAKFNIVAINDISDTKTLSYLLKYDSIHGVLDSPVSFDNGHIIVSGKKIPLICQKDPKHLDWTPFNPDFVVEATGKYKTYELLEQHLKNGAKRVLLSAPAEDDRIKMIVMGVNEQLLDGSEQIISNASCTTNNAAPMIQLVDKMCTVEQAYITTVHSYTTDQSLHDQPHHDLRRARGAGQSIVPTTTGAAKALTKIFPKLSNTIGGCGIRVPVPDGSLTDITLNVKKEISIADINNCFKNASENELKGILDYTEIPIVSVDVVGNPHSCIFDAQLTSVIGKMVKIVGWYDNETGYANRLADLMMYSDKLN